MIYIYLCQLHCIPRRSEIDSQLTSQSTSIDNGIFFLNTYMKWEKLWEDCVHWFLTEVWLCAVSVVIKCLNLCRSRPPQMCVPPLGLGAMDKDGGDSIWFQLHCACFWEHELVVLKVYLRGGNNKAISHRLSSVAPTYCTSNFLLNYHGNVILYSQVYNALWNVSKFNIKPQWSLLTSQSFLLLLSPPLMQKFCLLTITNHLFRRSGSLGKPYILTPFSERLLHPNAAQPTMVKIYKML